MSFEIPLFAGASRGIVREYDNKDDYYFYGRDGLCGVLEEKPDVSKWLKTDEHASDAIRRLIKANPGKGRMCYKRSVWNWSIQMK